MKTAAIEIANTIKTGGLAQAEIESLIEKKAKEIGVKFKSLYLAAKQEYSAKYQAPAKRQYMGNSSNVL